MNKPIDISLDSPADLAGSTSRMLDANGVSLHVREWPKADAPVVLMVHGYPDASHVWDRCAPLLAEHFHVVAYDVRGAGKSQSFSDKSCYAISELMADFKAVIDDVSPDKAVHVLAHDWGSIQCWDAVTDPAFADRIASYSSISGPSLDHAGAWIANTLKTSPTKGLPKVLRQVANSWYIAAFHLPLLAPLIWKNGINNRWHKILQRVEGVEAPVAPSQLADGLQGINLYRANILSHVFKPQPRKTTVPVQLLVPTNDRFVSTQLFDDLPHWAPRLWRFDVEGGHWLPLEKPQIVAEKVQAFVEFIESDKADNKAAPALRRAQTRAAAAAASDKPYAGKLAIVTGAGGGIGRETLLALAAGGADVVAVDINDEANTRSADLARLLGVEATTKRVDVSNAKAMEKFANWVNEKLGAPDIVVNNAGIGLAGSFLDTSTDDWERVLGVNLWSVIHGSRLFAQQMLKEGKAGVIVNVASAAAFSPTRALSAYATSKAAVRMLNDCLRAELHDENIHVVSVCPGLINTGITTSTRFVGLSDAEQEQQRQRAKRIYSKRQLAPSAVAASIIDAIDQQRDEVLVGAEAHGLNLLSRLAPGLARRAARLEVTG